MLTAKHIGSRARKRFLAALAEMANVSKACDLAGVDLSRAGRIAPLPERNAPWSDPDPPVTAPANASQNAGGALPCPLDLPRKVDATA